ncbi:MAG: glycosyl transferase, partial [Clostridiales bacterium]|nr:glycosyl transferase [Clostridiales bacterium]
QIETVVVEYRDRPEGSESKLNTIPDGIKVLRTIVKLYRSYRPLRFFGIIAAILAALSVIFFIPVWMDYLRTGLVARFPTLIVCGIVMVVALLMFVSGVILSTLREKDRRDFEIKLVQADWMKKR